MVRHRSVAAAFNKQIKHFYKKKLALPYQQKISLVQHTEIEPYGPNRSWGLVTFPSIAVAGGRFNQQIDTAKWKFNPLLNIHFIPTNSGIITLEHYYS